MDMRFGAWNVRSMYRAGSLRAIAEEISKYIGLIWFRIGTSGGLL
jgi:hypothetical protein